MTGSLSEYRAYPYYPPVPAGHPASGGPPRFWHMRAKVTGDPKRTKHFWYVTRNPEQPWNRFAGITGHPKSHGVPYRDCLYRWVELRRELAAPRSKRAGLVLWCEGEKDADAARRAYRVTATSHHGGAEMAEEEQAEHFRGYRGRVLVVADRDDPGYACAWRRLHLLKRAGVRAEVVRPWHSVVVAGRCTEPPCLCPKPCPSRPWVGADLSDHIGEGLRLRELLVVKERNLARAAERWLERRSAGFRYGGAA